MGRRPGCEKVGLNRGGWTALEDEILVAYIKENGEGKWEDLPKRAGLKRCGKSCRLRWLNYLNPSIIQGDITLEEEELIIKLHKQLGNRWSLIAQRLPGRSDNKIKNYWNTILHKKVHDDHHCSPLPKRKNPRKISSEREIRKRVCCEKVGLNRGAWTALEDEILEAYIKANGEGKWGDLPKRAGLKRCGKSCRLRWLNYLNPSIIRGNITQEEEELILKLHMKLGNRWSSIAQRLPGRTDNEIKNYWITILHKKVHGNHPSSALPRRKPRIISKGNNSNSTVKPGTTSPPTLVLPSTIEACAEDSIVVMQQPAPCQDQSESLASHSLENVITDIGPEDINMEDIDKFLAFLFEEEVSGRISDEDIYAYRDLFSEPFIPIWG